MFKVMCILCQVTLETNRPAVSLPDLFPGNLFVNFILCHHWTVCL